ncbi:MAG: substrate-binding domain-containing protein [Bifidobacterium tibiigranuli]|jgi:ribose transport system substrate-binding protein|uniref:substrate-binding domain-containing protein n=1 Tax=Bifidobacterium tibiigranuli TaxID=2172043 RepID=UPI0026EFF295|nr:substrate-binding domain-containing protein [Bifidobacterium tibiigranuli]MCI1674421.1 substrate-binding domain-containing protein [Bifidobacterium tibiigranuli]MCI1713929.1 substrate-binding domain-containing protein [Bifidobacterium tibiigranuli]MCI1834729.1 substrate-binding domain-containing protein [Bifidobacterium tibiigranuli]
MIFRFSVAKQRRRILAAVVVASALFLTGCGTQSTSASSPKTSTASRPSLAFVGPNGEKPDPLSALSLTPDEAAKVKAGTFTAAFVWHTNSDFVSAIERGARAEFKQLGIKVVSSTQANFDAGTQSNNISSVMALKPDIVVAAAVDAVSAEKSFKPIVEAGAKLVILTTPPANYHAGKQFVSIVTEDLAAAGRDNAEIIGDKLGGKGQIGVISYNANFWFTNQRDKSFTEWLKYEYPKMPIVDSEGFSDETATQTIAAAMIAKHPDIKGIYVSWATAAQGVLAAIRASGRTDIKIVTNDLDTTLAAAMLSGNNVAGMVGNGAMGIGKGLALAGAYGVLDKAAPQLVASVPTKVTTANLAKAWKADYGTAVPATVKGR